MAEQKTHRRLLIRPSYCDELLQLHRRLQDSEAAIVSATEAVAAKLKFPLSKIRVERHNAMFGVCCRIPKSKQRVLAKKPGIIQLAVQVCCYLATLQPQRALSQPLLLALQSGGVYFTTDVLQAASAAYHSALEVYNEAQSEVIQQVLDVAFTSVKRVVARGVSFCTNCRWVSQLCARY